MIQCPWGFVQEKSFDHGDLSQEETIGNGETGEEDKAVATEFLVCEN